MKTIRQGDTVAFRSGEKHLYGEIIKAESVNEETGEVSFRIACGDPEHPMIFRNVPESAIFRVFRL